MNNDELPTNSVLAVKLDYISKDISAIKKDVSDIKNDNITRREFESHIKDADEKVDAKIALVNMKVKEVTDKADFINKVLYSVVALVVTSIIIAGLRFLLK